MSINLHVGVEKDDIMVSKFHLHQTPTHITWMCLTPHGSPTIDIRHRYVHWVQSLADGVYTDHDRANYSWSEIEEHVAELDRYLLENPDAEFYWL